MFIRLVIICLFFMLISGCGKTYTVQNHKSIDFGVHSVDVPKSFSAWVLHTRINDAVLCELPKSKIDTSETVKGIAAKKLFELCAGASECSLVLPEGLLTNSTMVMEGLPTGLIMVQEKDMFKGAVFETGLGYMWMHYVNPVPLETIFSDIALTQKIYKPVSAASAGSYRTRYGAIEQSDDVQYWQTLVRGWGESMEFSVNYAAETMESDKEMINLAAENFSYRVFGGKAGYVRKRVVCGLEGLEWRVERSLQGVRHYEWFFRGEVPDVGKVNFEISLKAPRAMDEGWHEAVWNFILDSSRFRYANKEFQEGLREESGATFN